MARADLILDLIKYSFEGNKYQCKKVVEALVAEERSKQHLLLADKLQKELERALHSTNDGVSKSELSFSDTSSIINNFLQEVPVKKSFEEMVLPEEVKKVIGTFIEEQLRADLLRSYGLEPRHKIILAGKPGTGKTSFAEALAERLMVPLFVVRYDALIGSYLGETATRLRQLFDFVSTRKCILFFDEFDTIGKERGDSQELGEIKRVVSSLLLMTDSLPNYTIVIGASNHPELLDRAVWLWVFGWYLFKGKKIPWVLFVFLLIGFAGVLLVLRPDVADQNALYVGLGLLSGALSSGSSISLRLLGLKGEPPIRTLFWFALACTLSGGAATLMFSTGLRAEHVFSVPVLLMGVFTALGQWTQNIGWKKGKTLLCASLQFSAVIFAVIFGYLFFDEVPDTFTFLGILIIVAASLGATIFRLKYYKEG